MAGLGPPPCAAGRCWMTRSCAYCTVSSGREQRPVQKAELTRTDPWREDEARVRAMPVAATCQSVFRRVTGLLTDPDEGSSSWFPALLCNKQL